MIHRISRFTIPVHCNFKSEDRSFQECTWYTCWNYKTASVGQTLQTTAMIGLGSNVWCQWRLEKFFYNIIGDYWERNLTWLGGLFGLHLFGLFGYIGTILFLNRKFLFLNLNVWVLTIYVDEEFFLFYWMFHESIGIFEDCRMDIGRKEEILCVYKNVNSVWRLQEVML